MEQHYSQLFGCQWDRKRARWEEERETDEERERNRWEPNGGRG